MVSHCAAEEKAILFDVHSAFLGTDQNGTNQTSFGLLQNLEDADFSTLKRVESFTDGSLSLYFDDPLTSDKTNQVFYLKYNATDPLQVTKRKL